MARVRRAPEPAQLDLFGAKPAEVVVPIHPASQKVLGLGGLPGPMTAAESERAFTGNEYLGFCTTDGRCTCRACLDRLGADYAKEGRTFFHYLWPPKLTKVPVPKWPESTLEGPSIEATCRHCGLRFDVEPCAFKLEQDVT